MKRLLTLKEYKDIVRKRIEKCFSYDTTQEYKYYIFGAGLMGRFVYCQLKSVIDISGFIDSDENRQGTIDNETGLRIYKLDEVNRDGRIIIASLLAWNEIYKICEQKGYLYHCNYEEIAFCYDRFEHSNLAFEGMAEGILKNQERYNEVYEKLSDKISKEVLQYIISFRLSMDIRYTEKAYILSINNGRQYFDKEIVSPVTDEVFVDCGGYKGETVKDFLDYTNNEYKKIYLFEPDVDLLEEAKKNLKNTRQIVYLPYGVGNRNGDLYFNVVGDQSGSFSDKGTEKVRVVAIDNTIMDKVTFIKMDIEGMEKDALQGAQKTIRKYKPKLAISVYHKNTDIVDLAEYVLKIRKDYKIYLRHYTRACADTVMYFV